MAIKQKAPQEKQDPVVSVQAEQKKTEQEKTEQEKTQSQDSLGAQ